MRRFIYVLNGIVLFLLLNSCAKNPVTGHRDLMLVSTEQEIAMGQQSDPEIQRYMGVYDDARLQQFINEKGQQMAAVSHRKDLKYQFRVVDSPVVNAFAVPGGYVYFTRGIMAYFNNEAEFAGVLGHEIGHITARHSAKQYSNAMLAQLGLAAGMIISPELAQFGDLANTGVQLLFLKFGRDAESQSDQLGVEYSTKIGYDAEEMAGFFSTLDRLRKNAGGEEVPTFMSTHPDPLDREAKVGKAADAWKKKVDASSLKVNGDSYLRMIDGIVYGEDPKQGFVENNMFYHPVMKFQFSIPSQWDVQNTPEAVQMAPKDGKAMMLMTLAQGNSLDNAAQTFLQNYKLQVVESRRATVNGFPTIQVVADQQQDQQQQQQQQQQQAQGVRALLYFIEYGGNIYAMAGVTSTNDFRSYVNLFQSTIESFRTLTDPSKLNRQPERVRIKQVPQNGTLSQAFKALGVQEKRLEELATLNGMRLEENVAKGKLIKIVQ
jgi:predicted Zn-dependent protease